MRIPLDRNDPLPLYRQVGTWLSEAMRSGGLPAGTRLPATRELAVELGVSRITVQNAYAGLESDGLILTRAGSGTFVAPTFPDSSSFEQRAEDWPQWQKRAAPGGFRDETPAIPRSSHPDLISFTGVGDPRRYPVKEFARSLQDVLRRDGSAALEYGPFDAGYPPLRATVAHILASQGMRAHPDQVLVTAGSQQALALVCQALLRPGDAVLVELPTYNLALELFRGLGLKIVGIPTDADGMRVELLEPLLREHRPGLIYTIPNFQNPGGACLSGPRRRTLLELAGRCGIPILEDDYAGDLRYEGRAQPAVKALDGEGRVIYVGTFSKMLMPGLRVGYLLADGPIFERLAALKRAQDLTTSPFLQRVLDHYVTVGRYQAHLRRSARLYRARRNAMLAAARHHLPGSSFTPPQGGLFLWLRLPDGVSSRALLPAALEAGVEFAPGARFFPDPADGDPFLRLNFAARSEEEIERGMRRLGEVLLAAKSRRLEA